MMTRSGKFSPQQENTNAKMSDAVAVTIPQAPSKRVSLSSFDSFFTRFIAWIFIGSIAFALGMSTLSYSSIFHEASHFLSRSMKQSELVWMWSVGGATKLIGSLLGGLAFVPVFDRLGRKDGIMFTSCGMIISLYVQSLLPYTNSMPLMCFGRFLYGLSRSMVANGIVMFVREVAPPSKGGRYNHAAFGIRSMGMSLEVLLGFHDLLSTKNRWVWLLLVPAIISLPTVLLSFAIPDTPAQLAGSGNAELANFSRRFYFGTDDGARNQAATAKTPSKKASIVDLLRSHEHRLHVIIELLMCVCVAFGGYPILLDYLVVILQRLHVVEASLAEFIATLFIAPLTFISGYFCDKWGRLVVLRTALCVIATTLLSLTLIQFFAPDDPSFGLQVVSAALVAAWMAFVVGVLFPLKMVVGEILTIEYRSAGFAVFMISISGLGVACDLFFMPLEESWKGCGFLLHLIPFCLAASLLCVVLPETNGLEPADAHQLVNERWKRIKCIITCHKNGVTPQPSSNKTDDVIV